MGVLHVTCSCHENKSQPRFSFDVVGWETRARVPPREHLRVRACGEKTDERRWARERGDWTKDRPRIGFDWELRLPRQILEAIVKCQFVFGKYAKSR